MGLLGFVLKKAIMTKRNKTYYAINSLMSAWHPHAISSINVFVAKFPPRKDCYGFEEAAEWFMACMLICVLWTNGTVETINDAISDYLARCKRSMVNKYFALEDMSFDIRNDKNKIILVKSRIRKEAKFCVCWMTIKSMLIRISEENLKADFDTGADMLLQIIEPYLIDFENYLLREKIKVFQ